LHNSCIWAIFGALVAGQCEFDDTIPYSETIYGLKQSSQMWYEKNKNYFLQIGFTLCDVGPNVCISKLFPLLLSF